MDEIVEIFGKRLKVVPDDEDDSTYFCEKCAIKVYCWNMIGGMPFCEDAEGKMNRHFEEEND